MILLFEVYHFELPRNILFSCLFCMKMLGHLQPFFLNIVVKISLKIFALALKLEIQIFHHTIKEVCRKCFII